MDKVEELIHDLESWQRAYPLSAFPEPDLERAAALLKAGGMTLDSVSASNMRHVVNKIVPPVLEALTVSREKLEACANAIQRADLTTTLGVDRNEQFTDPLILARAAAIALRLKVT